MRDRRSRPETGEHEIAVARTSEWEIQLDGDMWERGHYWESYGAPWAHFISAGRWFSYIIGPSTVLRRAGRLR